jgi:hypothetical protein
VLEPLSSEDLLHMQVWSSRSSSAGLINIIQPQTRELFSRAVSVIKAGNNPADEHALDVSGVSCIVSSTWMLIKLGGFRH